MALRYLQWCYTDSDYCNFGSLRDVRLVDYMEGEREAKVYAFLYNDLPLCIWNMRKS